MPSAVVNAAKMATPPNLGTGVVWIRRLSPGRSYKRSATAKRAMAGVAATLTSAATIAATTGKLIGQQSNAKNRALRHAPEVRDAIVAQHGGDVDPDIGENCVRDAFALVQ